MLADLRQAQSQVFPKRASVRSTLTTFLYRNVLCVLHLPFGGHPGSNGLPNTTIREFHLRCSTFTHSGASSNILRAFSGIRISSSSRGHCQHETHFQSLPCIEILSWIHRHHHRYDTLCWRIIPKLGLFARPSPPGSADGACKAYSSRRLSHRRCVGSYGADSFLPI